ncbi:MAG: glycoside hydrolase family 88 protein [Verrucomicrobia bacterium]|nr:glycoside hydrolase family 88 protein [Verrucomicrobiota bacterium]
MNDQPGRTTELPRKGAGVYEKRCWKTAHSKRSAIVSPVCYSRSCSSCSPPPVLRRTPAPSRTGASNRPPASSPTAAHTASRCALKAPLQATPLPDDGAGSSFPKALPSAYDANEQAAVFSGEDWFETAGPPGLAGADAFTVEVLFNPGRTYRTAHGTTGMLVSQYATAGGRGGWYLGTRDNQLRFGLSRPNGVLVEVSSAFAGSGIAPNADYYAAAVFRSGRLTFHLQNLTAGEALQTVEATGLPDRWPDPDVPLKIGSFDSDPSAFRWQGWVDEVRLSDAALEPGVLLAPSPAWPHRPVVDGLYLPALGCEAPAILVPRDKRVPFGWPSFSLSPAGQPGSARLTWPAMDLPPGDDIRLRLTLALDVQETNRIEVRLATSGTVLGTVDFIRSTVIQIDELRLTRDQAAQVLDEGLELVRTVGVNPLRLFAPTPSPKATPAVLQPHLLVAGADTDPWDQFFQRFRGLDLLQNFGWMEGCVLDGLYDLAQAFPGDTFGHTLVRHLDQYLVGPNLIVESSTSTVNDNALYGVQATLPFAVIGRVRPDHPSLDLATEFWWDRSQVNALPGLVDEGAGATTEPNYTVAYPMLVIARQRGDLALEHLGMDQYRIRRPAVVDDEGDIWRGYRHDTGVRTFENWARGVAWYYLGLMRGLVEIRDRDDLDDLHAEALRVMEFVLRYQQPDGLWRNFLHDDTHTVDTSGSAGIAAALALGYGLGLYPEAAREGALRARDGLRAHLTPDGLLAHAAPGNRSGDGASTRRVIYPPGMGMAAQLIAALEQPTFTAWRRQHFTAAEQADPEVSGPLASPALDGVPNLLKYALDLPPRVPVSGPVLLLASGRDAAGRLELRYDRLRGAHDVAFVLESSLDLKNWQPDRAFPVASRTELLSDRLERVHLIPSPVGDPGANRFFRLRLESLATRGTIRRGQPRTKSAAGRPRTPNAPRLRRGVEVAKRVECAALERRFS